MIRPSSSRFVAFVSLFGSALAVLGSTPSCKPGAAAEAVRPADPSSASVIDATSGPCREVDKRGEPLVVDWKAEERAELELAMRDGVAVVHYDCKGLSLVRDCNVEGVYGYRSVTLKEQVIDLENADELRANLPAFGGALAAKLDGELKRGSKLDVALAIAGKARTSRKEASVKELSGSCKGATHFVRGAYVGAFALSTATRADVRTAAQVFGASAEGASQSKKSVMNVDGSIEGCRSAPADSDKPAPKCSALLRLELVELGAAPPSVAGQTGEPVVAGCPEGLVRREGKCTAPAAKVAHTCKWDDTADCEAQCTLGDLASCTNLGFRQNPRLPEGNQRAKELFERACNGGEPTGCYRLGVLLAEGREGVSADPARAAKVLEQACAAGVGASCRDASVYYDLGVPGIAQDVARSLAYQRRGCNSGDGASCVQIAYRYRDGKGVPRDPGRAAEYFQKGLDGRLAPSYYELGLLYSKGEGVPKNAERAKALFKTACDMKDARACDELKK